MICVRPLQKLDLGKSLGPDPRLPPFIFSAVNPCPQRPVSFSVDSRMDISCFQVFAGLKDRASCGWHESGPYSRRIIKIFPHVEPDHDRINSEMVGHVAADQALLAA